MCDSTDFMASGMLTLINDFPTKFITGRSTAYEKESYLYPLFARSYADSHLCVRGIDSQTGKHR
jgi:hypothetical protein